EFLRTNEGPAARRWKPVDRAVRREQTIDRLLPAGIPELLEPLADFHIGCIRHDVSPSAQPSHRIHFAARTQLFYHTRVAARGPEEARRAVGQSIVQSVTA